MKPGRRIAMMSILAAALLWRWRLGRRVALDMEWEREISDAIDEGRAAVIAHDHEHRRRAF